MGNEIPNAVTLKCTSILTGETPILVDDQIKTVRDIFLLQSGKPLPTFALNDKLSIVESHIIQMPKEIYIQEVVDIRLSNGFHMEVSPGTLLMSLSGDGGWKPIVSFNVDDKVFGCEFSVNRGVVGKVFTVTHIEKKILPLQTSAYTFICEHGNLLLPKAQEDKGSIEFVCVQQ